MDIANYITYAVALGIAAVIPGPGIIALVARALGTGMRPTMPMLFGVATGDVIYLAAAILGLAYIASTFGTVFIVLKYAGAAYLLYMAYAIWRSGITTNTVETKRGKGATTSFMAGLLVTLGNPKTIVFYLALLPNLFDLTTVTAGSFTVLVLLTYAILLITLTPYVALADRARLLLQTPSALRFINRVAAMCLAGAAAAIATRAN